MMCTRYMLRESHVKTLSESISCMLRESYLRILSGYLYIVREDMVQEEERRKKSNGSLDVVQP
jgi:hypothetical protein